MKNTKAACSVKEFKALMQTDPNEYWFIRNMEGWIKYIEDSDSRDHPLQPLTKEEVEEFTKELVFNKGGVAGLNVGVVQKKLSYLQYKGLMSVFGMGVGLAADHEGYTCQKAGDCKKLNDHICTSNC